jgi:predicted nucleic acid-binding protein
LIDTALFPGSIPAQAFMKAVMPPYTAVVCDYSVDEMRRVYNRKFPHKIQDFERFIATLARAVKIVDTPLDETGDSHKEEKKIRDLKDHPIYRAAIAANADIFLTGDRDFLESGISLPMMITAIKFMRMS